MPRGTDKIPLLITPGGVREDVGLADVKDGDLLSSSNWLTRQGVGRPRPGYEQLGATLAAADAVIGIGFHGSPFTDVNLVVHTLTVAYEWDGTLFNVITGTWTASTLGQHVRFTLFIQSGNVYLLRINEANAIDEWTGTGNFASTTGAPAGRDMMTVNGRVVVIAAAGDEYAVQWSNFNDRATWTATDITRLTNTPGELIACAPFGPLSGAIYAEDAVYLATAVAARPAFQFNFVTRAKGPMSTACLVQHDGVHYWLANDLVVYRFDGSGRPKPIGTALVTTLRNTLSWANRNRSHGFILDLPEPELWFVYPDSLTGTLIRGLSLNLTTGAMNPHRFTGSLTASLAGTAASTITWNGLTGTWNTLSFGTWDSMGSTATRASLLGTSAGLIHNFNLATDDDGIAIAWEFIHGYKPLGGLGNRFYLDGIASYWRTAASALTVTVGVTVTDTLGETDPESTATFDMSTDSDHLAALTFPNLSGTHARVRHSGTSALANIEHRGAALIGWKRNYVASV